MGSHCVPEDELDEVQDVLLQAMPPERRDEMRAHLRAAQDSSPETHAIDRRLAVTRNGDVREDQGSTPAPDSALAPLSPITPERAAQIADDFILAATRVASAPSLPPLPAAGPGTGCPQGVVAAGGEGLRGGLGVRADRKPLKHAVRLSDVTPERVSWLWSDRIPAGKLTVLDGDPGLGKSTLLCEVAARVSRGEPFPGAESESGPPRGVLIFSAEDDLHDTIRPRIDAAGGALQRIVSLIAYPDGTETGRPFALPADLPLIEAVVAETDAALVIFDPLVAYLRLGVSANVDQNVRHALAALKKSAERTGAAIVVVRHLNKSRGTNPLYRGLGSIGIIGAARSGLLLAADPDDPDRRVLAVSKGNLARHAPSLVFRLEDVPGSGVARVVWEGESPWTAAELLQVQTTEDGDETRSAIDEARTWLREALAAGPRPAKEVRREAAAQGIGRCSLYAARKAEGMTTYKERVPRGQWFWSLGTTGDGKDAAPPSSLEVQHL